MKYDVVIIGSGLGGLQTAYMLAKAGMRVAVLEQNGVAGGCLQSFQRAGTTFETGFHYIGGLAQGQPLERLFNYFGLMDLPWKQLDSDCFDRVVVGNREFSFAQGYDNFAERMTAQFPHQREQIQTYTAFLQKVGDSIFDVLAPLSGEAPLSHQLLGQSAHDYLTHTITDPLLRKVLSGTSLKMHLDAPTLPLYVFAQINSSFIQSAWRIQGGGSQIADTLIASIRTLGGEVRTRAQVTRLIERDGKITQVEINGDERIETDWVISNAHPKATLELLPESKLIRKSYRGRIMNLNETFGMFTINAKLKPNTVLYQNYNTFKHTYSVDMWNYSPQNKVEQALVVFAPPTDGSAYAQTVDILAPMSYAQVSQWADSQFGHRPADYKEFKQTFAEQMLDFVCERYPELRGNIERYYTSTPLSYQHYTRTAQGSAYGIMKDYNNTLQTVLTPKTPVPNLLLTGQNLNLHGILGVSMTSLFTAAQIIGLDKVKREIND